MRNLVATQVFTVPSDGALPNIHQFCVDSEKLCLWFAASEDLFCVDTNGKLTNIAPLSGHMTSGDAVVAMECLADLESVCLALSSGDVLVYNVLSCDLECVGGVDAGLTGMSWSPDQEVVLLVTKEDKLVLMTMSFDPITETSLHPDEFGEVQPVTVGWGKKETQFHGSQGKPKPQAAEKKPVAPAANWDDRQTRISWRGDGEYFVCSSIDPSTGARCLRVRNRLCVLQSTSKSLDGLGQCLGWRPSGNLIASSQIKPHRQDIVFFERNGLQHGEFPIGEGAWLVQEVSWNNDSSVLAVLLRNKERLEESKYNTKVQLWIVGNYHWYLKQEIRIDSTKKITSSGDLVGIIWDPIKPLRLHILTADGDYQCYNWRWSVLTNHTHSTQNSAPVAVIDGSNLLLTPFRHSLVPPPMATHTLTLPTPVISVSFAPPPLQNEFVVLLVDGQIVVFRWKEQAKEISKDACGFRELVECPKQVGVALLCVGCVRCVIWWKPDKLLGIGSKDGNEVLMEFSLSLESESVKVSVSCSVPTPSPVFSICTNPNTGTAILQLADGKGLLRISSEGNTISLERCEREGLELPAWQTCEQIALAIFNDKEYVVGLNEFSGALYVGKTKITSGCTSFAVHNEFLLLTTTAHLLRFVSLNSDPQELPAMTESSPSDEMVRRVERGSKLVSVVPYDSRVVLQMPRGNLETIHPRALVLSSVRRDLDCVDFKSAFVTMRKHRINLNLIHDHNPQLFMSHIREFVEQLDNVAYINLFLTELKEEDVTKTMYSRSTVSGTNEGSGVCDSHGAGDGSKVDCVCEAVRGVLNAIGRNKYLLSLITTYVRETTPNLEAVLTVLKELKAHAVVNEVEEAIKHTLLLVDVNELYNVALGMYDFDLVLIVAEKSQKDPKEYLPFLNELRLLPIDYQRYKIDLYLRRYVKALQHICKCGEEKFPECLSLISEHSLYPQALSIFSDQTSNEYKEIASCYGFHLRSCGRHREAGLLFAQCGEYEEALKSCEKAGEWRQVFVLSAQLKHSMADRVATAKRLANNLRSTKRHSEAAQVLVDYAQDIEEGVVTLLEGSCWEEAFRMAYLHSRSDLIETHIQPHVLESTSIHLDLFESLETKFLRHFSRLEVVRRLKKEKEKAILEGTYVADEKDADLFSDTSSMTAVSSVNSSILSKASGRSSKNRRKAERKKHSLREGSAHEDLALLEALSEIVTTVDRLQDEIANLLGMHVLFGNMAEGKALQRAFEELVDVVNSNIKQVWSTGSEATTENKETSVQGLTGPRATVNSIVAAFQSQSVASNASPSIPTPKMRDSTKWKLNMFS